jgi:hypothetical protein
VYYLALGSVKLGVQHLGSCLQGWDKWFSLRKVVPETSFHQTRVQVEVDIFPRQSPYPQFVVLALLQTSEPLCKAHSHSISILHYQLTPPMCVTLPSSWLKGVIRIHLHPMKHSIVSYWLVNSPPCGPSVMNHINCSLVTSIRCHCNCYYVVSNVFCSMETTETQIMINVLCEVGKDLKAHSNVIL